MGCAIMWLWKFCAWFFGWLFRRPFEPISGWFFGWLFWSFPGQLFGLIFEGLIHFLRLEEFCLRTLDQSAITDGSPYYARLNQWGFYWVRHRTALTVWRKGKFVEVREAPEGHRWRHIWPRLRRDEIGPAYSLKPAFVPCTYDDVPTSMSASLVERLGNGKGALAQPSLGHPVGVKITLIIGFFFKPLEATVPDAVESALQLSHADRQQSVCRLSRPEVERLTGLLSPVDLRLRLAEPLFQKDPKAVSHHKDLKGELHKLFKPLGYEIISVKLETVTFPPGFETNFVANQELLRQSIQRYSPGELARMLAVQIGYGSRAGTSVTQPDLGPLIRRSLNPQNGLPPNSAADFTPAKPDQPEAPDEQDLPDQPRRDMPPGPARWKKH